MAHDENDERYGYRDDVDPVAAYDQAHSQAMDALREADLFFLTIRNENGRMESYCSGNCPPKTILALANFAVESCVDIVNALPEHPEI